MHAYPIYNWEYEENNEEGDQSKKQRGPDNEVWTFLYKSLSESAFDNRKEWPLIWSDSEFNARNANLIIDTSQIDWPAEEVGSRKVSASGDFTPCAISSIETTLERPPEHPEWLADECSLEIEISIQFSVNTSGVVVEAKVLPGEHEKYPYWGEKALLCVTRYKFPTDIEHSGYYQRSGKITYTFRKQ